MNIFKKFFGSSQANMKEETTMTNTQKALDIQMIYNTVHQVLAHGNYVLAVSEGTFGGAPTAYYDLWHVEDGKIAEHWDVMETIADKSTWQNQSGKF